MECLEPNCDRTTKGPTPIEKRSEAELLAAIKTMAVVEDNYMVATFAFARTTASRARSFASRLRGMAETCEFHEQCTKCDHIVDHSESRVLDQLCIGMADPDIQEDLMEATKRMTVEQTLRSVEKKMEWLPPARLQILSLFSHFHFWLPDLNWYAFCINSHATLSLVTFIY